MTNQRVNDNASRLFERGKYRIERHDGTGVPIITKENTQRKFCVELGSRRWGVGTPMIITKLPVDVPITTEVQGSILADILEWS